MERVLRSAGQWLEALNGRDAASRRVLESAYGPDEGLQRERTALLLQVLKGFVDRFGDRPVRVFRSPGRINLRGMHVDTHGGYLNLMTHQRETIVAVTPADGTECRFGNVDPAFEDVSFAVEDEEFGSNWPEYLTRVSGEFARGHWGRYMKGAALRCRFAFSGAPIVGLCGMVGSDVPRGAALSSSAALCVATVSAFAACSSLAFEPAALILAARDAEWYAGSRCGVSDQAAMVLGGRRQIVNVALFADQLDVSPARRVEMPDAVSILVINSFTSRSLSGNAFVEYTQNRFAYSLALAILREEMRAAGSPEEEVSRVDRLSRFSPEELPRLKDPASVYGLLRRVPEAMGLQNLKERYRLPELERAYEQYFGSVPEAERPRTISLRGPLLFGLAESERARVFAGLIEEGHYADAGRLMCIGHDGDRRFAADGSAYRFAVDDEALQRYEEERRPLAECAGAYGASSPVLDALVDAAMSAGALGASLTGAGIAGAVLALCRAEDAERVAESVREYMGSEEYRRIAGRTDGLSPDELTQAVVENCAVAGAGELMY